MKVFVLILFVILNLFHSTCTLSKQQEYNLYMLVIRDDCKQDNIGITSGEVLEMLKGNKKISLWGKCFLHCALMKQNALSSSNDFQWEKYASEISKEAPKKIAEPAIVSIKNCKDAVKTPLDECQVGYEIANCIYVDNPENYFVS